MIDEPLRTVAELQFESISPGGGGRHGNAGGDAYAAHTGLQPTDAGWAQRFAAPGVLSAPRKQPKETRAGDGMADKCGPDIRPGIERGTDRPEGVKPGTLPGPANDGVAHQQLDLCPALMQKCGGFESALSPSNDHDFLAAELFELAVIGRV